MLYMNTQKTYNRQQIMSYFHYWMNSITPMVKSITWSIAHLDCTMCQETMCSLIAERSFREKEGGKNKCLEEWRKTSQPSDMCKALVRYLSSPYNICGCVYVCASVGGGGGGTEHLTDENFTLSVCPAELCRFEPMHLIKHLSEGAHIHIHSWVLCLVTLTWVAS